MSQAEGIVGEYLALARETEADLLAMQLGDFYEFFGENAELVGEELDLKVSQKSSGGETYPMAGVPVDELDPYLKALVERGYRVAVAEQYETDDGHAREVTRVVTPGTLLSPTDADARYLAAVVRADAAGGQGGAAGRQGGTAGRQGDATAGRQRDAAADTYGLAFADVTTGQFLVTEVGSDEDGSDGGDRQSEAGMEAVLTELYRFDPVEVLPGPAVRNDEAFLSAVRERTDAALSPYDPDAFAPGAATHAIREQFGDPETLGLAAGDPAVRAAGGVLAYVEETGAGVLASMTRLRTYRDDDHVALDATTQRNLELTETMRGDRAGSLAATVDHTVTSAGGRLLREWLTRPRRDLDELRRRQDAVEALSSGALAREELREVLGDAADLERLASRAMSGSADARDLLQVRDTLGVLPALAETVEDDPRLADSPVADVLARPDREAAATLREELAAALADDPPSSPTAGGLIRPGYHDELDELIARHEELQDWFDGLEKRVKRRHGLTHVTVDRNKTDGYYVQVGKSEADGVPEDFEEIKTLKNSRRFRTDELADRERELLRLEERRGELERELFEELRERVASRTALLQAVGRALAEVDVLATLSTHAVEHGWTRPELTDGDGIAIDGGRHPVVEGTTEFVPNDARLGAAGGGVGGDGASGDGRSGDGVGGDGAGGGGGDGSASGDDVNGDGRGGNGASDDGERADGGHRFMIVTGPNMSGKSTYLRQTALIVLLAQVGSFVPADAARIGLVDGIYTRVGALDELAQGRSTFMVEMQELSNILHSATEESLVILDEVGRGTATYDGISIAWAAVEYLHNEIRSLCLFATHYHELTTLAEHLPRVTNVHVAAEERDGEVTFLRTIRPGPTDRSYGIHVADLAGVPEPVVDRSRDVLAQLREEKSIEARGSGSNEPVQAVFDLGSGQFRREAEAGADGGEPEQRDPASESVLEDLQRVDVNEVPPVELMAKVREWQERLEEG